MPDRACPACRTPLQGNVSADGVCLACGHDLAVTAPRPNWVVADQDLRAIARWQRALLWIILGCLMLHIVPIALMRVPTFAGLGAVFAIGALAMQLVALVFVIMLMSAMQYNIIVRILLIVLMLAPCINLLVLLHINGEATRVMRAAGLRVGLLGVADEQVVRLLGANRCRTCGYMLVGNTSGVCPECGNSVASA